MKLCTTLILQLLTQASSVSSESRSASGIQAWSPLAPRMDRNSEVNPKRPWISDAESPERRPWLPDLPKEESSEPPGSSSRRNPSFLVAEPHDSITYVGSPKPGNLAILRPPSGLEASVKQPPPSRRRRNPQPLALPPEAADYTADLNMFRAAMARRKLEQANVELGAEIKTLKSEMERMRTALQMYQDAHTSWVVGPLSQAERLELAGMTAQRVGAALGGSTVAMPIGNPVMGFRPTRIAFDPVRDPGNNPRGNTRRLRSRRDTSDPIANPDNNALNSRRPPPVQPLFSDQTSEFRFYMSIYTEIQTNVSNRLFPYFSTILAQTKNSLIYDLLWSVHSDLVAAGPYVIGPYSSGQTCFGWIQDQLFGNISEHDITNNMTIMSTLAQFGELTDMYNAVWGNATQIANATGYLSKMSTLRKYLNPVNKSIIPEEWKTVQPEPHKLSFTALYNYTVHP